MKKSKAITLVLLTALAACDNPDTQKDYISRLDTTRVNGFYSPVYRYYQRTTNTITNVTQETEITEHEYISRGGFGSSASEHGISEGHGCGE